FLIEKGYNPDFGARPLRRAIEHHVEDPISEEILRGGYVDQSKVVVSVKGEGDERHLYFEGIGQADDNKADDARKVEQLHETT
ncbi:MAG: hypothetical protein ACP5HU_11945, partial [Phycisphaerae bacterium]